MTTVAKKTRARKTVKASATPVTVVKAVKAPAKALSKKGQVFAMLTKAALSRDDIAKALKISAVAAYALIGDLRRDGKAITPLRVIGEKGKIVYHA